MRRKIFLAPHLLIDTNLATCVGVAKFGFTPDLFTPCPKTVAIGATNPDLFVQLCRNTMRPRAFSLYVLLFPQ